MFGSGGISGINGYVAFFDKYHIGEIQIKFSYMRTQNIFFHIAKDRTLKISFSVNGSIADSETVITAIVFPSALNTSSEYPSSPSVTG
jgi:hypothetical protein